MSPPPPAAPRPFLGWRMVRVAFLVDFIGMGGVVPLQGALCGRAFGRLSFGEVMGLMRPVQVPLHMLGIPLAAGIHDATGSFEIAFQIFLAVYVASCAVITFLRIEQAGVGVVET